MCPFDFFMVKRRIHAIISVKYLVMLKTFHVHCSLTSVHCLPKEVYCLPKEVIFSPVKASDRLRKKSQISRDFQGQIRKKMADFAGVFEGSFAEKRLVKNGWSRKSFPSKFRWKAIDFALIWRKFSMKLDAFIAFTQASYRNMKSYFTSKLIEQNKKK